MLITLQARLQQYVNQELPDVQAGFRKGRGTRDQIVNIWWNIEKAREIQKNIYFCFTDYSEAFDCVDYNKLWKILKEMGIPDHHSCLLRNLYAGPEAIVRIRHGMMDWFKVGEGVHPGCVLSPCLFNLYAEYIMWNAGLGEAQAWIKISGRNIKNLRYAKHRRTKEPLDEDKESEKACLKLHIQKTKIMGSGPITSWQNNRETMETVTDFIFLGSKITTDVDCSHEIKRHLLLERKATTKLDSILKKQRHYFVYKGPYSQIYDFSSTHVWTWVLDHKEGWVLKNWCFWTVIWEKTLESPLDCKEIKPVNPQGNESWIYFGRTDAETEAPILGHPMWRADSLERPWCWERLRAGGERDDRGSNGWVASSTQWIWVWASSGRWWRAGKPGLLKPVGS